MPATKRVDTLRTKIPERDAPAKEWYKAHRRLNGTPRWYKLYDRYLKSLAWSEKRMEMYEEKGVRCAAGFEGCTGIAYEVHHKTYRRLGDERVEDLEPVCKSCHKELHS